MMLLASLAWADRLYWTAPPSPEDLESAASAVPGAVSEPLDRLGGTAVAGDPARDIDALRSELASVTPLFDVFDGELQIMSRLSTATAAVTVLRDESDADVLWRALLTQGYAVHRYFQDGLATEPAAAPYRTEVNGVVVVSAWAEAAALAPSRQPSESELREPAERIAYDTLRAAMLVVPSARVEPAVLASGSVLHIDGVAVAANAPRLVAPGRHRLHVSQGDLILWADMPVLTGGQRVEVKLPIAPKERAEIDEAIRGARSGQSIPRPLAAALEGSTEPVYVAAPGTGTLWRVDSGRFVAARPAAPERASTVEVHARLGGGWVSTGDFFLQNVGDGAPYAVDTVNAAGVGAGLGVTARFGSFALGGGVDGLYSVGDHHSLPSGELDTRLFGWVHVNAGLPWVQLAVGPMFPWYVGVGGQAQVPVFKRVALHAGAVYGIPVTLDRGADPDFVPLPAYAAYGGVSFRLN